jgi:hypothetical protein
MIMIYFLFSGHYLFVSEAGDQVVVHHARGLHMGIDDGGPGKFKSAFA